MNTKLLETKLKSIDHYVDVIRDLEDARKITRATLEQLLKDLKEFCPFQKGDILCYCNQQILRFDEIRDAGLDELGPYFEICVYRCNQYGSFSDKATTNYYFSKCDDWTILKHAPAENKEQ